MEEAQGNGKQDFNPRSPHGERPTRAHGGWRTSYFNPRSPHGERRHTVNPNSNADCYFNPRSPHGERRDAGDCAGGQRRISIHAPRTGSDPTSSHSSLGIRPFQSTLPARGATPRRNPAPTCTRYFNPRSPHGERPNPLFLSVYARNFNPRSPHGERLLCMINRQTLETSFQSTLPARGATCRCRRTCP